MKVLGVGLSKTGTSSLHRASQILGYSALHHDTERLTEIVNGTGQNPDFRVYDDIDAVTDIPAAYFFRELLAAYPDARAILTVRNIDAWWQSIHYHWTVRYPLRKKPVWARLFDVARGQGWPVGGYTPYDRFRIALRCQVYGSAQANEFLYRKKYREHNDLVRCLVDPSRLLVMDITAGDGWEVLCPFLQQPVPDVPFPHEHKSHHDKTQEEVKTCTGNN